MLFWREGEGKESEKRERKGEKKREKERERERERGEERTCVLSPIFVVLLC